MVSDFDLIRSEYLNISENLKMKNPKLTDIELFGENEFDIFLNIFCTQPHEFAYQLSEGGKDFEDFKDEYDFFIFMYQSSFCIIENDMFVLKDIYKKMFKYYFNMSDIFLMKNNNEVFLKDINGKIINKKIYNIINETIRKIFQKERKNPPKFADSGAKEVWIMLEGEDLEDRKENGKNGLRQHISKIVAVKGFTYEYVLSLYYSQFKDLINYINEFEMFKIIYNGYYSNVDYSKIKIEKHHWLN